MFKLHMDYFRNGRGYHLKAILLSILSMFVFGLTMLIPGIVFLIGTAIFISSQDFYGEPSNGGIVALIISIAIGIIISMLVYIFLMIPLGYGMITFYKNTDLGISPKFKDLFMFLKRGKFIKTLKLSALIMLLSFAIYFVIYIVMAIIQFILLIVFGTSMAIINPENMSQGTASVGMIFMFLVIFVFMMLIYIPIYYVIIFILNAILVHIDQSDLPTFTKFSIAWNITRNGPNNAWKLLFSNLLYIIGVYIIIFIIVIIFAIISALTASILPNFLMMIVAGIGYIAFFLIAIVVSYFLYGSLVNFYHKNKNALYPKNESQSVESNE